MSNIKPLRINNRIRVPKINLIDENGKPIGIVETQDALRMAEERNLDLVEVVPNQWPPICKIMDYGKYQYRKSKQERKKKIKNVEIKGIRFGIKISKHDLEFKANQTDKFLKRGDKVRIEVRLKGREKSLEGFAKQKINDFFSSITEPYKIEQELKKTPTGLTMVISQGQSINH